MTTLNHLLPDIRYCVSEAAALASAADRLADLPELIATVADIASVANSADLQAVADRLNLLPADLPTDDWKAVIDAAIEDLARLAGVAAEDSA